MPTDLAIRAATLADADAVADVYLASFEHFLPYVTLAHDDDDVRQWIRTYLVPTGGVRVAIVEHAIVGMLALSQEGMIGWINQLYVRPGYVQQGIGTQLLQQALHDLAPPVHLYTFQANAVARRFYERHGFRAIAFGDGSDNEEKCPDVLYEWQGL